MDNILHHIKKFIPKKVFSLLQPVYHYGLALLGAILYRFPSRNIRVVGITGTKGKSSTSEILNAIFEESGEKTAMVNGIRFKIGEENTPNKLKMTMPGRFVIQKKMREAVKDGCTTFILEMTSEGTKQFRHKWIALDALIFTNLSPEHIESHGSYEKYRAAKLKIAKALEKSKKKNKAIVVNGDDKESHHFLNISVPNKISYHLDDAKIYRLYSDGLEISFHGLAMSSPLRGKMNIYNILAAATTANFFGVSEEVVKDALEEVQIPGRLERVTAGQNFECIVDYAHTADSLRQVYEVFAGIPKVCVLGATGGGRDKDKRREMGTLAEEHCEAVILTNEDPYDEDPGKIVRDVAEGMKEKKPAIIMKRREAIAYAISLAEEGDAVIITGKGTDPYIMLADGEKLPWSDTEVAREEIEKFLNGNK